MISDSPELCHSHTSIRRCDSEHPADVVQDLKLDARNSPPQNRHWRVQTLQNHVPLNGDGNQPPIGDLGNEHL